jgi:hypothetical protein
MHDVQVDIWRGGLQPHLYHVCRLLDALGFEDEDATGEQWTRVLPFAICSMSLHLRVVSELLGCSAHR